MLEHVASEPGTFGPPSLDATAANVEALEGRLNRGWSLISEAEAQGKPSDDLFAHFLNLLGEYESLLDARANS